MSRTESLFQQSTFLDALPVNMRLMARQISALLKIIVALNITGQANVRDLDFILDNEVPNQILLEIKANTDLSAELLQFSENKKAFETNFDQRLCVSAHDT